MKTSKGFPADNPDSFRTWKTKDGKEIRWGEMDLDHLSNTYHMLVRNAKNNTLDYLVRHCMYSLKIMKAPVNETLTEEAARQISKLLYTREMKRARQIRDYIKWRVETKGK